MRSSYCTALLVALSLLALNDSVGAVVTTVTVHYNATLDTFRLNDAAFGPIAATVKVNDTFLVTGWDHVRSEGNATFMAASDTARMVGYRAAGYGEAALTSTRIFQNYQNNMGGVDGLAALVRNSPDIANWISEHRAYLSQRALVKDDIGRQLGGLLALIRGLSEGYAAVVVNPQQQLNETDFFLVNFIAEIGDIVTAFSSNEDVDMWKSAPHLDPRLRFQSRHCSALVKILPHDVYFSHVTWNAFNTMLRQYKTYVFEGRSVTMSGYPGMIQSMDDWYMTSNRLAVMETTNGVNNVTLFTEFVRNGTNTISEFLRVMIANFIAQDSASWVRYFSTENSGTYNNQWMVFDMKQFTPGSPLPSGTFWVAEQLPGSYAPYGVTAADVTDVLQQQGYWASYNIPYFPSVFAISGNLELYLQYGDFFSYTNYSRAKIFKRNQSDVVDLDSMKALMRYNNFKNDPYSLITNCKQATGGVCNPPYSAMLSIASRGDLNPPGGESDYGVNYQYLTRRNHCGTDVKIATWGYMMNQSSSAEVITGVVINGPTSYQQPVFQWSTSPFANDTSIIRLGLPDVYNFPFAAIDDVVPPAAVIIDGQSSDNSKKTVAIALGVVGSVIVVVAVAGLLLKARAQSKDASEQAQLLDDRA